MPKTFDLLDDLGKVAKKAGSFASEGTTAVKGGGLNYLLTGMKSKTANGLKGPRFELKMAAKYADVPGVQKMWFRKIAGNPGKPGNTDMDLILEFADGVKIVECKSTATAIKSIGGAGAYLRKLKSVHADGGVELVTGSGNKRAILETVFEFGEEITTARRNQLLAIINDAKLPFDVNIRTPTNWPAP